MERLDQLVKKQLRVNTNMYIKELLAKKGYTQKNTFNMDETGLFYV